MKERLDRLLQERGLAESRQRAQALILSGLVRVDGRRVEKPGTRISPDRRLEVVARDHPYVSRGGVKLAGALEEFSVEVRDRTCLDVGASTGGFTDCLLQHGAARVFAVDVGRGQLDWGLRNDPRVVAIEGCNARYLSRETIPERVQIATVDVSFISLRRILPPLLALDLEGPVLALVKPQFELPRREVGKGGIVRSAEKQRRVLIETAEFCERIGLGAAGAVESPITGADGNREFFLHLHRSPVPRERLDRALEEIFHAP